MSINTPYRLPDFDNILAGEGEDLTWTFDIGTDVTILSVTSITCEVAPIGSDIGASDSTAASRILSSPAPTISADGQSITARFGGGVGGVCYRFLVQASRSNGLPLVSINEMYCQGV